MIGFYLKALLLCLSIMLPSLSWGGTYDPLLLRAQASIFPKIVLLDKNLTKKISANEVVITIVSTDQDELVAQDLKNHIGAKYGRYLGDMSLRVNAVTFDDFDREALSTAYIILQGSESEFEDVVSHASNQGRIVFSYSYTDFRNDSLISLYVKEKTYIYVNKATVQLYGISFLPIFYKIIKII